MASNEQGHDIREDTSKTGRGAIVFEIAKIVVTLVAGGAAGALINHYWATRQTIITYSTTTTSLGAGEVTKTVLPNLRLILDNREIPVVYTHTVELIHGAGPELDQASVGVQVSGAKLLGNVLSYGPDPVHQIACKFDPTSSTLTCSVGRISAGSNPYKIVMATDQNPTIRLSIDAKNTRIQRYSEESKAGGGIEFGVLQSPVVLALIVMTLSLIPALILNLYSSTRRSRD